MGKITKEAILDLLYNKKLPELYREEDSHLGFPLKRYLESLIEGGYYGSIKDIEGLLSLIDPMTVPEEFFPYLCESFGFPYHKDMDISYQRKFLANMGELRKRYGTYSSVHYLVRALTGLDIELKFENGSLYIELIAKNLEQLENIDTSLSVVRDYIEGFIPFFVTPVLSPRIATQVIGSKSYSHSAIGNYKFYTIGKNKEVV